MAHPVFIAEELKSCPFCGGSAEFEEGIYEGEKVYSVSCRECHCSTAASNNRYDVINSWNERDEFYSCPFCGGHADISELEENGQIFFAVVCEDCGMCTKGSNEEDEGELPPLIEAGAS